MVTFSLAITFKNKMSQTKKKLISVVLPTFNAQKEIKACLNSVFNQIEVQMEVINIENHSSDRTSTLIKKHFPAVKIVPQKKNLGYAKAINLGIKRAKGSFIFLLNSDVVLAPDYLKKLLAVFDLNSKIGLAGGKIVSGHDRKTITSAGPSFSPFLGLINKKGHLKATKPVTCDLLEGSALLIKKKVISQIGRYDENYPLYWEDSDFCWRAKSKGWQVYYQPQAIAYHLGSQTVNRLHSPDQVRKFHYFSLFYFLKKNLSFWQAFSAVCFNLIFICPFLSIKTRENYLSPAWSSLLKNLINQKI